MKSSSDILSMVYIYKKELNVIRQITETLYHDTYGLDLKISYDADRIQMQSDPTGCLIAKIVAMDKRLEQSEAEMTHYLSLINMIEDVCKSNLNETELLVVRTKFFTSSRPLTRDEVAEELRYSPDWVKKVLLSAYMKLDQVFALRFDEEDLEKIG